LNRYGARPAAYYPTCHRHAGQGQGPRAACTLPHTTPTPTGMWAGCALRIPTPATTTYLAAVGRRQQGRRDTAPGLPEPQICNASLGGRWHAARALLSPSTRHLRGLKLATPRAGLRRTFASAAADNCCTCGTHALRHPTALAPLPAPSHFTHILYTLERSSVPFLLTLPFPC